MTSERRIRVTVVGDPDTGKTCMLIVYKDNKYDETYIPTVFDSYSMMIPINGQSYQVILSDTAGQEEYDKLRPLSYPETDVFLVCYAVNNRTTFDNLMHKWIPELKHYKPSAKIVLVGTKIDLRDVAGRNCVSIQEGEQRKNVIKAEAFVECSAKLNYNIAKVMQAALTAIVTDSTKKRKIDCVLL